MKIRKAAVSGYFYPGVSKQLSFLIERLLGEFQGKNPDEHPKALIVPHAGYEYSGRVAASGYSTLVKDNNSIKKIILLGPCHHVAIKGIALSSAEAFETPMGLLEIDTDLTDKINNTPGIFFNDEAHKNEHSLEVQIPFLQNIFKDAVKILPALTNMASPYQIRDFLEKVWGGSETRIVISSDLSHYLNYRDAKIKDSHTANCITNFKTENFNDDDACGLVGIQGFLTIAKERGMTPHCILLENSGDHSGDKTKVVGYGAFSFV